MARLQKMNFFLFLFVFKDWAKFKNAALNLDFWIFKVWGQI